MTTTSLAALPPTLPIRVEDCRTLPEYREHLLAGISQSDVARAAGVAQSRISAIETGQTIPKRKHWPALLRGYQLQQRESEFYRMVRAAAQLRALQRPISETEPLLAMATGTAAPVETIRDEGSEVRAQAV